MLTVDDLQMGVLQFLLLLICISCHACHALVMNKQDVFIQQFCFFSQRR